MLRNRYIIMNNNKHLNLLRKLCDTLESTYRQSLRNMQKVDSLRSSKDETQKPFIDSSLNTGNLLFDLRKRNN